MWGVASNEPHSFVLISYYYERETCRIVPTLISDWQEKTVAGQAVRRFWDFFGMGACARKGGCVKMVSQCARSGPVQTH